MSVSAPSPLVPPPPPVLHGPGRRFHASFRLFLLPLTWLAPIGGTVVGTLLMLISSAAAHTPPPAYLLPRFALAIFVLSALWTLLVLLLYITVCPTVVTVDGVKGFTFWGLPILLRWDEVAYAERKSFLGCPFLTISSNRRRQKLWMALPLADLNGFLTAVGERDGPDSTIVRALTPF